MPGVFLGDHVKGRLAGDRHPDIELGIRFHRAIDAFVDAEPGQRASIDRFDPRFKRFGGIICDVVYDYFLANSWQQFSDVKFEHFCERTYQHVLNRRDELDEPAKSIILRMQASRSLENYRHKSYVDRSLNYISTRLRYPNPLADAFEEFDRLHDALAEDFLNFIPPTMHYADTWLNTHC